jgi:hypothetical protein
VTTSYSYRATESDYSAYEGQSPLGIRALETSTPRGWLCASQADLHSPLSHARREQEGGLNHENTRINYHSYHLDYDPLWIHPGSSQIYILATRRLVRTSERVFTCEYIQDPKNWRAIEAIANPLLERGTLSSEEIDAVVESLERENAALSRSLHPQA